jgi:glycosyltransferase involved in cell wall biosynthesis
MAPHLLLIEEVYRRADQFDVVHFHIDYLHYPVSRRQNTPHVTTLHGRLDLPELRPLYHEYDDMPVVSISDAQRRPLRGANWQATVYHGLPPPLYRFRPTSDGYLAFLGRISPEKRVDRAIDIAQATDRPLKIAAKVDPVDQDYFASEIEPLMKASFVEYLGEIGEAEKEALLGGAAALLFPIDWPEPFGLVMIEALACGTPVIAYRRGSVPEVLADERIGAVVSSRAEAVRAVRRIDQIERRACRAYFEERFQVERMARAYLRVYRHLVSASVPSVGGAEEVHDSSPPGSPS